MHAALDPQRTGATDAETLENLIDRYSLAQIVESLSAIAHAKAQHLEENWQDAATARTWTRDAKRLDTVSTKIEN